MIDREPRDAQRRATPRPCADMAAIVMDELELRLAARAAVEHELRRCASQAEQDWRARCRRA